MFKIFFLATCGLALAFPQGTLNLLDTQASVFPSVLYSPFSKRAPSILEVTNGERAAFRSSTMVP